MSRRLAALTFITWNLRPPWTSWSPRDDLQARTSCPEKPDSDYEVCRKNLRHVRRTISVKLFLAIHRVVSLVADVLLEKLTSTLESLTRSAASELFVLPPPPLSDLGGLLAGCQV